ncbi:MAG: DUF305 domain-containing protein [Alphaproteobacteria bacterium]|nr:DUF305 domain-containing protein [Alphaproteobacteria bacterium]
MKYASFIIAAIACLTMVSVAHAETTAKAHVEEHAIGSAIVKEPAVPTGAPPAAAPAAAHAAHAMAMTAPPGATPATKEFIETNSKMHSGMMIDFSDNADVDFVKGMIPHHQGAVDMAKIVLKYGKDPEIKKFAEDIIKAQSAEIKFMNDWLAKHPK